MSEEKTKSNDVTDTLEFVLEKLSECTGKELSNDQKKNCTWPQVEWRKVTDHETEKETSIYYPKYGATKKCLTSIDKDGIKDKLISDIKRHVTATKALVSRTPEQDEKLFKQLDEKLDFDDLVEVIGEKINLNDIDASGNTKCVFSPADKIQENVRESIKKELSDQLDDCTEYQQYMTELMAKTVGFFVSVIEWFGRFASLCSSACCSCIILVIVGIIYAVKKRD